MASEAAAMENIYSHLVWFRLVSSFGQNERLFEIETDVHSSIRVFAARDDLFPFTVRVVRRDYLEWRSNQTAIFDPVE